MPKIEYRKIRLGQEQLSLIAQANAVIATYTQRITLRQLYYRLVAKNIIPNNFRSYKNLGNTILNGRMAGLIDWEAIEDRMREPVSNSHWSSPAGIIASAARSYAIDKWEGQEYYIEVFVEKDALAGVVEEPCRELDVVSFACRGYGSATMMWETARRLQERIDEGRRVVILHFGDHDPSGMDMTRDIRDRLITFLDDPDSLEVERIALNMDQIERYNPPPQPAKTSDIRFKGYAANHGNQSWELDSLEPTTLVDLIETNVLKYRDEELFEERVEQERRERESLLKTSRNWEKVEKFVTKLKEKK